MDILNIYVHAKMSLYRLNVLKKKKIQTITEGIIINHIGVQNLEIYIKKGYSYETVLQW